MYPFTKPLSLIRYLVVWRVNSSLVRLPACLAPEISRVVGSLIAERLPTREAAPWHKALAPWKGQQGQDIPADAAWPLESVLFVYPGKRTCGPGEVIPWELKLLGDSAEHSLFLEVLLPAMEAASTTTDPRWQQANNLWGRFDLHNVYAARGKRWEPFVQEGRLNLRYRPTPEQWLDGLTFDAASERLLERLDWPTPFDLAPADQRRRAHRIPSAEVPTLKMLLDALVCRLACLLPGKHKTAADVWAGLDEGERSALQVAVEAASRVPVRRYKLGPAPQGWPGRWRGEQTFPFIPPVLLPYLELASILHIGKQTHLGCGTFTLT